MHLYQDLHPAYVTLSDAMATGTRDAWNAWPVNLVEYGPQPTANVREFSREQYLAYDSALRAGSVTVCYLRRALLK